MFPDLPITYILGRLLELRGTFSEAESSERGGFLDCNSTEHRKVEKHLELGWLARIERMQAIQSLLSLLVNN
jgi:hypothetical protein